MALMSECIYCLIDLSCPASSQQAVQELQTAFQSSQYALLGLKLVLTLEWPGGSF